MITWTRSAQPRTRALDRCCTLLAIAGIAALTIRRWALVGAYPTGLDGAQWLAIGRGLHGFGRSTGGPYPPLLPLLATIGEALVGPLPATRLLAVSSMLTVALAIWFVARAALGPVWGLLASALVLPASALAEPTLFGGYPQQVALAAGLVALWQSCQFLTTGTRGRLWLIAVAALVAATAHHVYFPLFVMSIATASVLWLAGESWHITRLSGGTPLPPSPRQPDRPDGGSQGGTSVAAEGPSHPPGPFTPELPAIHDTPEVQEVQEVQIRQSRFPCLAGRARALALAIALSPALLAFVTIARSLVMDGYAAPLAASARDLPGAWLYATREAPLVWFGILIVGLMALVLMTRSCQQSAWLLAAGLLLPAGLLLMATGQPRLLPPVLLGATIAAGLGARHLARSLPGARGQMALTLGTGCLAIALLVPADRAARDFAEFYRVVDESVLRAAAAVAADGQVGAVAVRQDRRGWPIGWWFEALLARPIIVGSDQRWLAFPRERENARLMNELFDGGLTPATFRGLVSSANVRYLLMPKWDWIGWERWLKNDDYPIAVIYDDDRYLVLRVTTRLTQAASRGPTGDFAPDHYGMIARRPGSVVGHEAPGTGRRRGAKRFSGGAPDRSDLGRVAWHAHRPRAIHGRSPGRDHQRRSRRPAHRLGHDADNRQSDAANLRPRRTWRRRD